MAISKGDSLERKLVKGVFHWECDSLGLMHSDLVGGCGVLAGSFIVDHLYLVIASVADFQLFW